MLAASEDDLICTVCWSISATGGKLAVSTTHYKDWCFLLQEVLQLKDHSSGLNIQLTEFRNAPCLAWLTKTILVLSRRGEGTTCFVTIKTRLKFGLKT